MAKGSIFCGAAEHTAMAGKQNNAPSGKSGQSCGPAPRTGGTKVKQQVYGGSAREPKTTKDPNLISFTSKK